MNQWVVSKVAFTWNSQDWMCNLLWSEENMPYVWVWHLSITYVLPQFHSKVSGILSNEVFLSCQILEDNSVLYAFQSNYQIINHKSRINIIQIEEQNARDEEIKAVHIWCNFYQKLIIFLQHCRQQRTYQRRNFKNSKIYFLILIGD